MATKLLKSLNWLNNTYTKKLWDKLLYKKVYQKN